MKIFHLADSKKLTDIRLISASWAQKHLIPTFMKIFDLPDWKKVNGYQAHFAILSLKTFDSNF